MKRELRQFSHRDLARLQRETVSPQVALAVEAEQRRRQSRHRSSRATPLILLLMTVLAGSWFFAPLLNTYW